MKIAIYSDIHDNIHNLDLALNKIKELEISKAICLGDFINPGIIKRIISFGIPTHFIWGNNDGEKVAITKLVLEADGFSIAGRREDRMEIEGRKVALLHHETFAKDLAQSGNFDAVFYGHTHEKELEMVDNCILANPGEISGHLTGVCSFIVWNTDDNSIEFIQLENSIINR